MMRFDCRNKIEKDLKDLGLYRGKENNNMRIGFCTKSKDVIEPYMMPKWYVNCQDMASRAVSAVRQKELVIEPEIHDKKWFEWLENIKDWCISRQLWWGHRIPAYLVSVKDSAGNDKFVSDPSGNDHWVAGRTLEEAERLAREKFGTDPTDVITLTQDEDVLDTWFSSGLFPFSTLGWPNEEDPDFKAFYPGTLLETGHDILFFWVARMVMMGLELTDKLPFTQVYLHAMIRDE
jgi:valyl-tRNA synthetase